MLRAAASAAAASDMRWPSGTEGGGWLGTTISYDSNKVSIDGSIHSSQHHWNEVEKEEEEEERIEN